MLIPFLPGEAVGYGSRDQLDEESADINMKPRSVHQNFPSSHGYACFFRILLKERSVLTLLAGSLHSLTQLVHKLDLCLVCQECQHIDYPVRKLKQSQFQFRRRWFATANYPSACFYEITTLM
nr:hypothetical protein CFP56_21542 [Quercus suber]